jgi:isopenicillin N synthase-like dioxygenase
MPVEVTEIPTLDLRCTLVSVGFLYIKNHNVPQTTITKLVDSLPHLFALPQEAKEEVALINSP